MKNIILLFLFIFATHGISKAQEAANTDTKEQTENKKTTNKKMFIWKPNHKNERYPELKLNQKNYLLLLDERTNPPKKSKIECSGAELIQDIVGILKTQDINNNIELIDEAIPSNGISVKIAIKSYHAHFFPEAWRSEMSYQVTIYNPDGSIHSEREIETIKRFYNIDGYNTSKETLSTAYFRATTELIEYLGEVLQ